MEFYGRFIAENEKEYINQCLQGEIMSEQGYSLKAKEKLCHILGSKNVFLTPSCTSALELAFKAMKLKDGDEVIMPSFNFPSAANAVINAGGKPVFCDIEQKTQNISVEDVKNKLTKKTKAIVPIHYAGVSADMDNLTAIAQEAGALVVEDAAQALGSKYNGRALSTIGDMGAISFHYTKNISCGEGGLLTVRDKFCDSINLQRMHGTNRSKFLNGECDRYTWNTWGSSCILSQLSSAILYSQLENINIITEQRRGIADIYSAVLNDAERQGKLTCMQIPEYAHYNGHIYYILLDSLSVRDRLMEHLRSIGVDCKSHYFPLHTSPMGCSMGYKRADLPKSARCFETLLRLPIHSKMDKIQAEKIAQQIIKAL